MNKPESQSADAEVVVIGVDFCLSRDFYVRSVWEKKAAAAGADAAPSRAFLQEYMCVLVEEVSS